ncbi:MAG: proline--tRNA ligase [Alphaproteobacteria bacterium]|nr:proline--tRNA ligase [Alphaproteobacteria bacterium]
MPNALPITRSENFAEWYQTVVRLADMAETSPVRGCMIIKPWGWGVWERIQQQLDRRFKETGHQNCYFPLFIPMSFLAKEAEHVEGFAKEMAVVTHHRLKTIDGKLQPDPDAKLEEPLIVRPTSETIIGDAFQRWIQSYRDLPMLLNQWANVVRWEMRPRLFLRTTEFLWQEGHTAHADKADAMRETRQMLEVYREFAENVLAMPVVAGEKTANERFPGADNTYSIEAMMQDGKALQAGTSHYLGTHFAEAQNIRYQTAEGGTALCHTTSWGVSTRLIGGVIMNHGDDDGLRLPPAIAPHQIVLLPILRDKPEDAEVSAFTDGLARDLNALMALGAPIRAFIDRKPTKAVEKRWDWVRRGAPIIIEIGPRDAAGGNVTFLRRDQMYDGPAGGKAKMQTLSRVAFAGKAGALLEEIQKALFDQAAQRLRDSIRTDLRTWNDIAAYFGADDDKEFKGWVRTAWSRPTGAELDKVSAQLKELALTIRNAPLDQRGDPGTCVFTGKPAVEEILIARSY